MSDMDMEYHEVGEEQIPEIPSDEEPEPEAQANGQGRRPAKRTANGSHAEALKQYRQAKQQMTKAREALVARRDELKAEIAALEHELAEWDDLPAALTRAKPAAADPGEPREPAKSASARKSISRTIDSKPSESLPTRIFAFLVDNPQSGAGFIAKALDEDTPKVSAALGLLRKRGKVVSLGQRPSLLWSAI